MKDILGREVPEGALVIVKPTGRYSSGLHCGLMMKTGSVFTTKGNTSKYNAVVWLDMLSDDYIKIKNELEEKLEEKKLEQEAKKKIPTINKFEKFHLYKRTSSNGDTYLYYIGDSIIDVDLTCPARSYYHTKTTNQQRTTHKYEFKNGWIYLGKSYPHKKFIFKYDNWHEYDASRLSIENIKKPKLHVDLGYMDINEILINYHEYYTDHILKLAVCENA